MTPPPADVAAGRLPRGAITRAPRRVSGPARRAGADPRRAPAARAGARSGVLARLRAVPDARLLDRLVRGRGWIAIVGVALIGIVFMQVSLLNLNAGISRAVTSAETLERQNATLRESIAQLDTGERISDAATEAGMVMPSAGEVTFLDARRADGRKAAASVRPPKPVVSTAPAAPDPAPPTAAGTGAATGADAAGAGAAGAGATGAGAAGAGAAGAGAATGAAGAAGAGPTGAGAAATGATGTAGAGATGAGAAATGAAATGAAAPGGAAATSSAPPGAADPAPPAAEAAGPGAAAATGAAPTSGTATGASATSGSGTTATGTGGAATGAAGG
jgi:cell division protein FtsL